MLLPFFEIAIGLGFRSLKEANRNISLLDVDKHLGFISFQPLSKSMFLLVCLEDVLTGVTHDQLNTSSASGGQLLATSDL